MDQTIELQPLHQTLFWPFYGIQRLKQVPSKVYMINPSTSKEIINKRKNNDHHHGINGAYETLNLNVTVPKE